MINSLWISKTGMQAQQTQLDVISNNLANVSTNGFKRANAVFEDLMYQNLRQVGSASSEQSQLPTGLQLGTGVRVVGTARQFTQGNVQQSSNNLDVAIQGNGFFKVRHGDEDLYTRAGNFTLDSEGFLTTPSGDRLQPEISLPAETVTVTLQDNGTLTANGASNTILATANVLISSFVNPSGLFAVGNNLLRPTEGSGPATEGTPGQDGLGTVVNNYLEGSNVSVVEEMVAMISGQRTYEANSKSIQTADSMLSTATGLKR